jgi:hypothetical protein
MIFNAHTDDEDDIFGSGKKPVIAKGPRADRAAMFGQQLLSHWIGQLRHLPQEEAMLRHFNLPARVVSDVANQLIIGAERVNLAEQVAAAGRAATDLAALRWDDVADRIVTIALYRFNTFVAELGFSDVPFAKRPGFPKGEVSAERRIFEPRPDPGDHLPLLGDAPETFELRRFIDWGIAFLAMGVANLSFGGGRELTDEQNAALGNILRNLAAE